MESLSDVDLLRRLRAEQRELQGVVELETERLERSRRSLAEVVAEHASRGDVVRIAVGLRAWTGLLVHATRSLTTLRTAAGVEVDIALDRLSALRAARREPCANGGLVPSPDPVTLLARLRDLERTAEMVEVGGAHIEPVVGVVLAAAPDHLDIEATDGAEWSLALSAVDYVIRGGAR